MPREPLEYPELLDRVVQLDEGPLEVALQGVIVELLVLQHTRQLLKRHEHREVRFQEGLR